MRRHVDAPVEEGPKSALTVRNLISRPLSAAFGNGSERARGTLKNPDGPSGRARAELGSSLGKLGLPTCGAASPTIRQRGFTNSSRQREFSPHTRAKKLARAAECLVYSLTPSGVLAENHPKNRGFVSILRGQKCLKRRFSRRSPVGEWSRGARSMPRVFGRGSRSQPAALVIALGRSCAGAGGGGVFSREHCGQALV